MSLCGPTFHVTAVDLCIIFQCNLYISCIMSCGNNIVSNFKSRVVKNFTLNIRVITHQIRTFVSLLIKYEHSCHYSSNVYNKFNTTCMHVVV